MSDPGSNPFKRPWSPAECRGLRLRQKKLYPPSTVSRRQKYPLRRAPVVLDEDDYVDQVSDIIQRDYFPELSLIQARSDYLDALERHDVAAQRRLRAQFTPIKDVGEGPARLSTPDTFETPEAPVRQEPEAWSPGSVRLATPVETPTARALSLDQFLAAHTSEDNASFNRVMDEQDGQFRSSHQWLFKDEENHALELKAGQLRVPSLEAQFPSDPRSDGLSQPVGTWTYTNANPIFYPPEGVPLSPEALLEAQNKAQAIVQGNTRFRVNPWKSELPPHPLAGQPSASRARSAGKVGPDGRELEKPPTPAVRGFKFLKMMPSPAPGVGESPLMTWGEIEDTPARLDGASTPLPMHGAGVSAFSIQDVPKRDRLAHELAEKNSRSYRDKRGQALEKARSNVRTPQAGGLSGRVAGMSPAAQRLASAKFGIRLGTDPALKAAYTPSPVRRTAGTPGSRRSQISSAVRTKSLDGTPTTPVISSRTPGTPVSLQASASLTDDLLNLPATSKKANTRLTALDPL